MAHHLDLKQCTMLPFADMPTIVMGGSNYFPKSQSGC
jgi:hypothetical protein